MKDKLPNVSLGQMGAGSENLPLGLVGSGLLLTVFTGLKSSISLFLMAARDGHEDGFPFLFETVLVFPFTMQVVFYTAQTCWQLRSTYRGLVAIRAAVPSLGPCCFYATFITSTTLLETYSLQFILPSMFVVLKQLTMVVIAMGEVLLFAARPSSVAWSIISFQAVCVGLFQYSSASSKPHIATADDGMEALDRTAREAAALTLGVCACLLSVATGGMGSILQQRFMQKQAKAVPISVKLLWQHAIELCLVIMLVLVRSKGRSRLLNEGFFSGWNKWACIVSVSMWFSFLTASAISAYISALSGAFAVAVSVALTGVLEFVLFGRVFTGAQFVLMICVCLNAVFYTKVRMSSLGSAPDDDNRGKSLSPKPPKGYHSVVGRIEKEKPEDTALLSLCEDGTKQTVEFGTIEFKTHNSEQASTETMLAPAAAATTNLRTATDAGMVEL